MKMSFSRILPGLSVLVLCLAAGGPARAQDLPDATRAVSREVTYYIPEEGQQATRGVSREVTLYTPAEGQLATRGVSREVTFYTPVEGPFATLGTSREVTARFNYTLTDVRNALRIAAGIQAAPPGTSWDFGWLNADVKAPSATVIDVLDALAMAYGATHP